MEAHSAYLTGQTISVDGGLTLYADCREPLRLVRSRLVRSRRPYDVGRVLDADVPALPRRCFRQTLVTTAHHRVWQSTSDAVFGTALKAMRRVLGG